MASGPLSARFGARTQVAIVGGVVAALLSLAVGAVLLSTSFVARQIVDDAIVLDEAELTLAANEIAVKTLNQAVLLREDELLAVADAQTATAAVDEARRSLDHLSEQGHAMLEVLPAGSGGLERAIDATVTAGASVVTALDRGEVASAGDLLLERLPAFETLRDQLGAVRDSARSNVEAAEGLVGRTGSMVAFLIALIVPIAAILAYRQLAKQQVHVAEVELDARIAAEQEISRSKDELIGNISHELRTPLTSIFGFSELLLDQGLVDPESSMELIGFINHEAGELGRMIEDILTIARAEGHVLAYQFDAYDLQTELRECVSPMTERGVAIDLAGPPLEAWFDRIRFRQVVRNLVSNAERHGGPNIRITWQERGATAEIVVADDGPGVDPAEEARLFAEFFHQGEAPLTKGTLGMGLAAVRILAHGMKGSVRYERAEGWTRFVVTLPTAAAVGSVVHADFNLEEEWPLPPAAGDARAGQ